MPLVACLQQRDGERGGFAGAGAGLAENIHARQVRGNQQGLDFRRRGELGFGQSTEDGRSDAQGGKRVGHGRVFGLIAQRKSAFWIKNPSLVSRAGRIV